MAGPEREGERPREELTSQQINRGGEASGRPEGEAETPLTPVLREGQGWQERPHKELVAAFRQAIRRRQCEWEERGEHLSPAQTIASELFKQAQYRFMREEGEYADYRQLGEFYYPILNAWQVIAFEHLGSGSGHTESEEQRAAGQLLSDYYRETGETVVRLSERQGRILDALADAADVPYEKGQTVIEIPGRLRDDED